MAALSLTPKEWFAVRKRAVLYALKLTRSKAKAEELVQAAILDALDPEGHPWDPAAHPEPADFICDRVWSRYGNETTSYRVTHASGALSEADDAAVPSSQRPQALVIRAHEDARAARRTAAVRQRVQGDALIVLLLDAADEAADEPDDLDTPRPNAEAETTRRALDKGYTEEEIKNARLRLKRHALAVARNEDQEEQQS